MRPSSISFTKYCKTFSFRTLKVIKLSPQYEVFHDGPEVQAEGPVPDFATLKLNSTLMYGPTRFVMDGLLSESQCSQLLSLADEAKVGDGYNGDESPHSDGETFSGITLLRSAQLARVGIVQEIFNKLYINNSSPRFFFFLIFEICLSNLTRGRRMLDRVAIFDFQHGF